MLSIELIGNHGDTLRMQFRLSEIQRQAKRLAGVANVSLVNDFVIFLRNTVGGQRLRGTLLQHLQVD